MCQLVRKYKKTLTEDRPLPNAAIATLNELIQLVEVIRFERDLTLEEHIAIRDNFYPLMEHFNVPVQFLWKTRMDYPKSGRELYIEWRRQNHQPTLDPDLKEFEEEYELWINSGMLRDPVG